MPHSTADRPWTAANLRVQRIWRIARGSAAGAVQAASGLFGSRPTRVVIAPQDLRTADPSITADLYAGHYVFAGKAVHCGGESPFSVTSPSQDWTRALYGFAWLRHLKAAETPIARALAQALVEDFLSLRPIPREAMEPTVLARRAISLMAASPFLLEGVDGATYRRFMRALLQHSARLRIAAIRESDPLTRLECTLALLHVGLSIDRSDDLVAAGISQTARELGQQIGGDGGHASRDPGVLVNLLLDMLPLRQCFLVRGLEPPGPIIAAIDRMMAMIRHMRHADGAIAQFNGAGYVARDVLATLIAYDDVKVTPETGLDGGYARLAVRDAVLIADCGAVPALAHAARAHAGALAFEFSADGRRWIVNCGATAGSDSPLAEMTRATAAHSTAVLHDSSSAGFMNDGPVRRLVAYGPVEAKLSPAALTVTASQDGYRKRYGVTHQRRLVLSPEGDRLDGADSFSGAIPAGDDDVAIRFHIHPAIDAVAGPHGAFVDLVARSGHVWRLAADGLPVTVEESIFLGGGDRARRTVQVVIATTLGATQEIHWSLTRSAAGPAHHLPEPA